MDHHVSRCQSVSTRLRSTHVLPSAPSMKRRTFMTWEEQRACSLSMHENRAGGLFLVQSETKLLSNLALVYAPQLPRQSSPDFQSVRLSFASCFCDLAASEGFDGRAAGDDDIFSSVITSPSGFLMKIALPLVLSGIVKFEGETPETTDPDELLKGPCCLVCDMSTFWVVLVVAAVLVILFVAAVLIAVVVPSAAVPVATLVSDSRPYWALKKVMADILRNRVPGPYQMFSVPAGRPVGGDYWVFLTASVPLAPPADFFVLRTRLVPTVPQVSALVGS